MPSQNSIFIVNLKFTVTEYLVVRQSCLKGMAGPSTQEIPSGASMLLSSPPFSLLGQ